MWALTSLSNKLCIVALRHQRDNNETNLWLKITVCWYLHLLEIMWQQQLLTFSIWDVSATNLTYLLLQIQKFFWFFFLIKTAVLLVWLRVYWKQFSCFLTALDRWLSYCDCLIVQQWVLLLSRLGWRVGRLRKTSRPPWDPSGTFWPQVRHLSGKSPGQQVVWV